MTSLEKPFGQHHAYFMLRKMYLLTRQVGQIMSQAFHKKQNSCPDYLKKPAAVLRPDFQAVGRRWEKVVGLHHTTLAVYLHRLNDPRGNCLEFIEKNCRRAWGHSKDFPEIFFYRNIAPKRSGWSRVPRCLHSESGLLSYRLFLERIAGRRVDPKLDFERVCGAVKLSGLEAPAWAEVASETAPSLLYFSLKPSQRFRGDFPLYLNELGAKGFVAGGQACEFAHNLSLLSEICSAMRPVLSHTDLLPGNILANGQDIFFLDWEYYCYAPAGFSLGNWLYTAFRKKPPQDIGDYLRCWHRWMAENYTGQNLTDCLIAGLFSYMCFSLEYLSRKLSERLSGDERERLKMMAGVFFRQFSIMGEPTLNPADDLIRGLDSPYS